MSSQPASHVPTQIPQRPTAHGAGTVYPFCRSQPRLRTAEVIESDSDWSRAAPVKADRRRNRNTAHALQRRSDDRKNRLLACLPDEQFDALKPNLQLIQLEGGQVLFESGECSAHVYFPITAVISLLYTTEEGYSLEVACVGAEGLVGDGLFMNCETSMGRAVVQCAGAAYRLPATVLKEAFERGGPFQHLLLQHARALIAQASQTAVCNRHHSVYQQFCGWLLQRLELAPGHDCAVTHEVIARGLGVRRESVTEATLRLRRERVIQCSRGQILVLDPAKLLRSACECHMVVKDEYRRLLPWKLAT